MVVERARETNAGAVFGLIVGLLIGVLIGALLIPARQDRVVTTPGAAGDGGGFTTDGSDVAGDRQDVVGPQGSTVSGGGGTPSGGSPSAAGGRAPSTRAAGSGGGGTTGGSPTGPVRGVSDNSIKVGIAILDLSALRSLGPAYDAGDPQQMAEGILDGWKRSKLVPAHGRDVRFVYRKYAIAQASSERSACVGFIQDDQVFLVQSSFTFLTGADCVSREFKTPMVTTDGVTQATMDGGYPFLFTLMATQDRILRNYAHWAHHRGALKGKKIGLYYLDEPVTRDLINRNLKGQLTKLGYAIAAEATTANAGGGPEDALAVQRFRSAGVDLAILMTSRAGFLQQAKAQEYRPTFIDSDFRNGVTDAGTASYPADWFDGTFGMTTLRGLTEAKAGRPVTPEEAACARNYERFSGRRVTPDRPAEWPQLQTMCDTLDRVILPALEAAGRGVTARGFVNAVETAVKNTPTGYFSNITFSPQHHSAGQEQRSAQWHASCVCWKAIGSFAPLWVE